MKAHIVGERICSPSPDEIRFDITDSGAVLLLKYNSPTEKEKSDIKSGKFRIGLAVVDDIIFVLTKFGNQAWQDVPFCKAYAQGKITDRPQPGTGIAMHIMLVDAATGILAVNRLIGLSTEFSNEFLSLVDQQPIPASRDSYTARLSRIYATYTTTDFVQKAIYFN